MKGLLLKDLLELSTFKKSLFLSLAIYAFIIIMNADNAAFSSIGSSMFILMFGLYGLSTFSYDEKYKTDKYILTLPIERKTIVLEKYILLILGTLLGIITSFIFEIIMYFTKIMPNINFIEFLESSFAIAVAFSIIYSFQVPIMFKFGAEKGRLYMYLALMGLFVVIGILALIFPHPNFEVLNKFEKYIPYIGCILIIACYIISYLLSLKIYRKKEV